MPNSDPYTDELRCLCCNNMFPIEELDEEQLCPNCRDELFPDDEESDDDDA